MEDGLGNCYYCGVPLTPKSGLDDRKNWRRDMQTIDHKIPKSKGGNGRPSNLVDCCWGCNVSKGDKDVEGFRRYRERKDNPSGRACQLIEEAIVEFFHGTSDEDALREIIRRTREIYPLPVFWGESQ